MKRRHKLTSLFLAAVLCVFLLPGTIPAARAAEPAPLRLITRYDAERREFSVEIAANEKLILSNYDLTVSRNAYVLKEIENGQSARFPYFVSNPDAGTAAAASSGGNVALEADAPLLRCTFSVGEEDPLRELSVTVTVREAADENGEPLPWKGAVIAGSVIPFDGIPAVITGMRLADTGVTVRAFCAEEGCTLICAAYGENGRLTALRSTGTAVGEREYRFEFGAAGYAETRAFLADGAFGPLCEGRTAGKGSV